MYKIIKTMSLYPYPRLWLVSMKKQGIPFLLSLCFLGPLVTCIYYYTQQGDINFQQAHRLFVKGKHELAIPYYEKSLAIDSGRLICRTELAYSYLWTDRPQQAIQLFVEIMKQHPEDYKIQFALAEAYSWTQEYGRAITLMKSIIAATDDLAVKKQLADVYLWDNHPQEAAALLGEMVQQYPEDLSIQVLLGKALYYAGESEKAACVFEGILQNQGQIKKNCDNDI